LPPRAPCPSTRSQCQTRAGTEQAARVTQSAGQRICDSCSNAASEREAEAVWARLGERGRRARHALAAAQHQQVRPRPEEQQRREPARAARVRAQRAAASVQRHAGALANARLRCHVRQRNRPPGERQVAVDEHTAWVLHVAYKEARLIPAGVRKSANVQALVSARTYRRLRGRKTRAACTTWYVALQPRRLRCGTKRWRAAQRACAARKGGAHAHPSTRAAPLSSASRSKSLGMA
jgi:hypothetical protein